MRGTAGWRPHCWRLQMPIKDLRAATSPAVQVPQPGAPLRSLQTPSEQLRAPVTYAVQAPQPGCMTGRLNTSSGRAPKTCL